MGLKFAKPVFPYRPKAVQLLNFFLLRKQKITEILQLALGLVSLS
jgi:hypothetical protein